MRYANLEVVARHWVRDMHELASWHNLATLQAITWEGDMGQRSTEYLYESHWARTNPERLSDFERM